MNPCQFENRFIFKNWTNLKLVFFFSIWFFFHEHSGITGLQEIHKLQLHPLYRHLDISRAITAGSSPLRIASSRTRTSSLWFPKLVFEEGEEKTNTVNYCKSNKIASTAITFSLVFLEQKSFFSKKQVTALASRNFCLLFEFKTNAIRNITS